MSFGPLQNLPGARETGGADSLAAEPWLLPISDDATVHQPRSADELKLAVRQAARPFWMVANGLVVAMALALTLQATTGWMSPGDPAASGPVADATSPMMSVQKASFAADH